MCAANRGITCTELSTRDCWLATVAQLAIHGHQELWDHRDFATFGSASMTVTYEEVVPAKPTIGKLSG